MPNVKKYYGTGRRKKAVARVYLSIGSGKIEVPFRSVLGLAAESREIR